LTVSKRSSRNPAKGTDNAGNVRAKVYQHESSQDCDVIVSQILRGKLSRIGKHGADCVRNLPKLSKVEQRPPFGSKCSSVGTRSLLH
jgi:hypothetical protein